MTASVLSLEELAKQLPPAGALMGLTFLSSGRFRKVFLCEHFATRKLCRHGMHRDLPDRQGGEGSFWNCVSRSDTG